MIYGLYTAALAALVAGYAPVAVWRRLARGVPLNVRERLGLVDGASGSERAGWLHAVSVGEAIAALPLIEALRRTAPDLPLVMTTVTETGARVVRQRLAGVVTHRYFPLDFPGAARRVTDAIRPAFLICMETELWPNTLRAVARRGVPAMVANGRLSDRSFRRYRMVRALLRPMLDDVQVFAMQSEEDARRVIALGARPERVFVTGNLKHEPLPDAGAAAEVWTRLLGLSRGQPVWIAGSTHRGEEEVVLDAHRMARAEWPALVLVLAPRHPERVPELLGLVRARGWRAVRRSELPRAIADAGTASSPHTGGGSREAAELPAGRAETQRRKPSAETSRRSRVPRGERSTPGGPSEERSGTVPPVIVLDTVGELAQLYAVADVVFVGGSLVEAGGHNMLEAALRRKPVLFGPHTSNFREAAALLLGSGGGILVDDGRALAAELHRLLADPALRTTVGTAAWEAVAGRHGAVQATLELVQRYLLSETPS